MFIKSSKMKLSRWYALHYNAQEHRKDSKVNWATFHSITFDHILIAVSIVEANAGHTTINTLWTIFLH